MLVVVGITKHAWEEGVVSLSIGYNFVSVVLEPSVQPPEIVPYEPPSDPSTVSPPVPPERVVHSSQLVVEPPESSQQLSLLHLIDPCLPGEYSSNLVIYSLLVSSRTTVIFDV